MRVLTFRLPDDEANVLVQRAAKAGVSLSAYIRAALNIADDPPSVSDRLTALEQGLAQLQRVAFGGSDY